MVDESALATVVVHHDKEDRTHVDGYQEPGSYVRPINYNMIREQFDELVDRRSYNCEQNIVYECKSSRLLQDVGKSQAVTFKCVKFILKFQFHFEFLHKKLLFSVLKNF